MAISKQSKAILEGAWEVRVRIRRIRDEAGEDLQGAMEEPELETQREGASLLSVTRTPAPETGEKLPRPSSPAKTNRQMNWAREKDMLPASLESLGARLRFLRESWVVPTTLEH